MKLTPQIFDVIERHVVFTFDAAQVQELLRSAALGMIGAEVDAAAVRVSTVIDMTGPAVVEVVQRLTVDVAQVAQVAPPKVDELSTPVPEPVTLAPLEADAPEAPAQVEPPPVDLLRHLRKLPAADNWLAEDDLAMVEWRAQGKAVREFADQNGRSAAFIPRRLDSLINADARIWTYAQLEEGLRYIIEGGAA